MAPKNDDVTVVEAIPGFNARDTKILAAAHLASLGGGKYDYDLMASLTGYSEGSIKKYWRDVKKKGAEMHPSFGTFLDGGKVKPERKREIEDPAPQDGAAEGEGTESTQEAPFGLGRPRKGAKKILAPEGAEYLQDAPSGRGRPRKADYVAPPEVAAPVVETEEEKAFRKAMVEEFSK